MTGQGEVGDVTRWLRATVAGKLRLRSRCEVYFTLCCKTARRGNTYVESQSTASPQNNLIISETKHNLKSVAKSRFFSSETKQRKSASHLNSPTKSNRRALAKPNFLYLSSLKLGCSTAEYPSLYD